MVADKSAVFKMRKAFSGMMYNKNRRKLNSRQYEEVRKVFGEVLSLERKNKTWNERLGEEKANLARQNISKAHLGKPKDSLLLKSSAKKNLQKAVEKNTGTRRTEEVKRKISIAHKGKVFTETKRGKMSETRKRKLLSGEVKSPTSKRVSYKGVVYETLMDAAKVFMIDTNQRKLGTARKNIRKCEDFKIL